MVEVFKTNAAHKYQSEMLVQLLQYHLPGSTIHFDLDDCDKVLRISAASICAPDITDLLHRNGCVAEVMS